MGFIAREESCCRYDQLLDRLQYANVLPVLVASHPRSGTHLLIDSLRLNFKDCQGWKTWGERFDRLYLNLDLTAIESAALGPATIYQVLTRARRPVVKTHSLPILGRFGGNPIEDRLDPAFVEWLRNKATVLYTYRDGRDVMTSLHKYMQVFDPRTRVPISEFIRQTEGGISRPRAWAAHVRNWCSFASSSVFGVRMEEMLDNTAVVMNGIAEAIGLPLQAPARLPCKTKSVIENRWNRLFRGNPQSTAILGKPSDPVANNWRNLFSPADREFFQSEVGPLLQTLGYEDSDDWVTHPYRAATLSPQAHFDC